VNSADTGAVRMPANEIAALPADHRLVWATHLAVLSALVSLLVWLNLRAIGNAIEVWWISPTFSHCFLIIPISGFLIFRRRRDLASVAPSSYPIALALGLPLILFSIAGRLADINEFEQFAFVAILQVLIVAVLGPRVYRKILFPCLFLFFLVPTGDYLIDPLQRFTTYFVSSGLSVLGIPHFTEGNIIKLSNGIFEVAEACAGLRFLIATIAIGTLFSWLTYREWRKAVLFLFACFTLPVVANGFRALGIVLIAHWSDNRLAVGVDHIVYGWGFLVAVLLVLMLIGGHYADPSPRTQISGPSTEAFLRPVHLVVTSALSALLVLLAPTFLSWNLGGPSGFDASVFSRPLTFAGWQEAMPSSGWAPDYVTPDGRLAFAIHASQSSPLDVDVFVDYYAGKSGSRKLLSAGNKIAPEAVWHTVSEGTAKTAFDGRDMAVRETVISSGGLMRIVWWTYWTAGRFTASARVVKLEMFRNVFSRNGGAALLALSTPAEGDLGEARARLDRAFRVLAGIATRLQRASGS